MFKVLERLMLWLSLPALFVWPDGLVWTLPTWAVAIFLTRPRREVVSEPSKAKKDADDEIRPRKSEMAERKQREACDAQDQSDRESEEEYLNRMRFFDWSEHH